MPLLLRMADWCQRGLYGWMTINMKFKELPIYGRAASLRAGGVGLRYTCIINGKTSHLFYEDNNKWFVEKR